MPDEANFPHSSDVIERESLDGGFSAGWGLHMQPAVNYWIDSHTHMQETETLAIKQAVADWHAWGWAHRLRRHVGLDGKKDRCEAFAQAAKEDDRFIWLCYLKHTEPDLEHLVRCKELGASGLKLHNATLIKAQSDRKAVLSDAWHRVYEKAGELGMPVLWHVTQRHTDSPYTGGGRDSYWKEAPDGKKAFSNEDLLQDFLEAVAAHRKTTFIGAHQLHLGPKRLSELFAAHPNLTVDTSIGCFVAACDEMYEADRQTWRAFFLAHSDRLLFGTDVILNVKSANSELLRQHFLGHVRFLRQLRLPQEVLTRVAHANYERLAELPETTGMFDWGALRP